MDQVSPIKVARLEAQLTQQQVADWLQIPLRTYQQWETGRRTPSKWAELLVVEKIKRDGKAYKECH